MKKAGNRVLNAAPFLYAVIERGKNSYNTSRKRTRALTSLISAALKGREDATVLIRGQPFAQKKLGSLLSEGFKSRKMNGNGLAFVSGNTEILELNAATNISYCLGADHYNRVANGNDDWFHKNRMVAYEAA